jgi:hypothetical protein
MLNPGPTANFASSCALSNVPDSQRIVMNRKTILLLKAGFLDFSVFGFIFMIS